MLETVESFRLEAFLLGILKGPLGLKPVSCFEMRLRHMEPEGRVVARLGDRLGKVFNSLFGLPLLGENHRTGVSEGRQWTGHLDGTIDQRQRLRPLSGVE